MTAITFCSSAQIRAHDGHDGPGWIGEDTSVPSAAVPGVWPATPVTVADLELPGLVPRREPWRDVELHERCVGALELTSSMHESAAPKRGEGAVAGKDERRQPRPVSRLRAKQCP